MEAEARAPKPRKRRLPKGTSDYQAAWILDDRCAASSGACLLHMQLRGCRIAAVVQPALKHLACLLLSPGHMPAHAQPGAHSVSPPAPASCFLAPLCSDLDDTDLESEVESGDEGRPQHHSDDESLPDLEPNVDGPGGSSFRDVDTGTEFGMDVSGCLLGEPCLITIAWLACGGVGLRCSSGV